MAKNLINRYVWLVETIYKAGRITFEEINQKWVEKFEEDPIPLRTFHKWRIAAEEMFNLVIECEPAVNGSLGKGNGQWRLSGN